MDTNYLPKERDDTAAYEPTLLRILIIRRHWQKFSAFESQFKRAATELAEQEDEPRLRKVTVSRRQFERWYSGKVKTEPYPDACRVLEHMFGCPVQQLLAPTTGTTEFAQTGGVLVPQHRVSSPLISVGGTLEPPFNQPVAGDSTIMASEWPTWFGTRLAHLIALIDNWLGPTSELGSLQTLLHQEILMFDTSAPEGPHALRMVHALSRRQALATVAALPVALATSAAISESGRSAAAATDFFLSRCAASLTACWHLLRGSDLSTVDHTLSSYLVALEGAAQQQNRYQLAAAQLASQAHRICGIVALHRDQIQVRERHCKQALYYATIAGDSSSQASALISLASTHFYNSEPAQAATVYEQAFALGADMSPLQRSRVHAELAVVYGQLRRESDAIRSAGMAEELYPDTPEQDRSFLYAEFTPASLVLEEGLAYAALAEKYPDRGYKRKAADIFASVERSESAIPDRIRFEIINHQARTAVLLNDLDAFETYINRGLDGVVLLGSKQRRREMMTALQRAKNAWPRERRVRSLGERLQLISGGDSKELS